MRDSMLVQFAMNRSDGFVEGSLQKRLMVVFAVMVRRRAGTPLGSTVPDVLQAAIQQGQHIVRGTRIEQVVGVLAGEIDRGGVRHDAALPTVVMPDRRIVRSGASRAEPGRPFDLQSRLQPQFLCAVLLLRRRDHMKYPSLDVARRGPLHDLQRVDREDRGGDRLHFDGAAIPAQFQGAANRLPVDGKAK